ncbi:hypothetical protein EJB05_09075, partial [Eragrostis curvula]
MGLNKSSLRALSPQITVDSSRGVHMFEVVNYSQHRNLGVHSFIRSSAFHVGGCAWSIRFYPDGENTKAENEGCVTVGVELMTQDAVVTASIYSQFMKKSDLEASIYLRDDRLVIECTLRVIKVTRLVSEGMPVEAEIVMPPSDLPEHLGSLLKEGMGTDVTFDIQGKSFPAHRMLLAARSLVFKAELLGPMKEGRADRIVVHEIQPEVFEALLHFVYTDSLPSMDDDEGDGINLIVDLLVAADRYAMDRLKLVCERTLSRSLTVDNVSTVLVLANRHNCSGLKEACVEFVNSDRMDDVTRTQGYAGLKTDHPYVLIELFEKAVKLGKLLS